jgi:hypothetical protein
MKGVNCVFMVLEKGVTLTHTDSLTHIHQETETETERDSDIERERERAQRTTRILTDKPVLGSVTKTKENHTLSHSIVADATASIHLSLWDTQVPIISQSIN